MTAQELAAEIVDKIVDDLTSRKGLRHQWDIIDDEIQAEIGQRWREIVLEVMIANP